MLSYESEGTAPVNVKPKWRRKPGEKGQMWSMSSIGSVGSHTDTTWIWVLSNKGWYGVFSAREVWCMAHRLTQG